MGRQEAERRAGRGGLLAAYLVGSVVRGEPLLGGTADIDLILIHEHSPEATRETRALSEDVHLDIQHHVRQLYDQPRQLRVDPWLGPALCQQHIRLLDPKHFFDWAQAGASAQFDRPDHVLARAMAFLSRARGRRTALHTRADWLPEYLLAAMEAANAMVSLTGPPAAGRRMMLHVEAADAAFDGGSLYPPFMELMGGQAADSWNLPEWLTAWARVLDASTPSSDEPELSRPRRDYLVRGLQALAETGHHDAVLWPLVRSWSLAVTALPQGAEASQHMPPWNGARQALHLAEEHRRSRLTQLETFMDQVELSVEAWGQANGA